MTSPVITLLGRPSSINVRKVLWTGAELALPLAVQPWGSGGLDLHAPAFLALNPNAQVPVITEAGADGQPPFVLWESNTICRYLAARESRDDLLPTAPRERARVEQWMDWQATELNPAWRYAFMSLVRQSPAHQDAALRLAGIERWNRAMQILEGQLSRGHDFVAGDAFTLADIVLGLSTCRWRMTPFDALVPRPVLPAVQAWLARLRQRPGFRQHADNGVP